MRWERGYYVLANVILQLRKAAYLYKNISGFIV